MCWRLMSGACPTTSQPPSKSTTELNKTLPASVLCFEGPCFGLARKTAPKNRAHRSRQRCRSRGRRCADGVAVRCHAENLPPQRAGHLCQMALGAGGADAVGVLRFALAGVGAAASGLIRFGCTPLLHFWHRPLPAGLHLPDRDPGDLGVLAVLVHGHCRTSVVWLCLPADRIQ